MKKATLTDKWKAAAIIKLYSVLSNKSAIIMEAEIVNRRNPVMNKKPFL